MDEISAYGFLTVMLAFFLACAFASCHGMLRFKLPGDAELTMARAMLGHRRKK